MSEMTQNVQHDGYIEKLITTLGQRLHLQIDILQAMAVSLDAIESHLRQIAISSNPAPNYRRSLSDYQDFEWASIGAIVLKEDSDGATEVEWNGQVFTRRSPENKYDAAIWFSRSVGKDADGNNKYVRLITFKAPAESGPIARRAKKVIRP